MTKYIFQRTQQTLIVLMMRNVMINWKNFFILERAGLKKGVSISMWNICSSNFSTRLFIGNFQ